MLFWREVRSKTGELLCRSLRDENGAFGNSEGPNVERYKNGRVACQYRVSAGSVEYITDFYSEEVSP